MTLLVGITVPSRRLNPMRRAIRFCEPGIIIAADTRFSYWPETRTVDDAQKLWPLGDKAFAGYAGDVEVAERALLSAHVATRYHQQWDDLDFIVSALRSYLRFWHREVSYRRSVHPTTVLLGVALPRGGWRLFRLCGDDEFRLRQRTGLVTTGSGKAAFDRAFVREVDRFTRRWAAATRSDSVRRTPSGSVDVPLLRVVNLIVSTADIVVAKEGLPTVGGWTQIITLSAEGMYSPEDSMRLRWRIILPVRRSFHSNPMVSTTWISWAIPVSKFRLSRRRSTASTVPLSTVSAPADRVTLKGVLLSISLVRASVRENCTSRSNVRFSKIGIETVRIELS